MENVGQEISPKDKYGNEIKVNVHVKDHIPYSSAHENAGINTKKYNVVEVKNSNMVMAQDQHCQIGESLKEVPCETKPNASSTSEKIKSRYVKTKPKTAGISMNRRQKRYQKPQNSNFKRILFNNPKFQEDYLNMLKTRIKTCK